MFNRSLTRASRLYCRYYASEATAAATSESSITPEASQDTQAKPKDPPLLIKLRQDLKTALQNKDTARLTAIRSLLDATNKRPPTNDFQVYGVLRRLTQDSIVASDHYKIAERQDLVDKQNLQTQIYEEYYKSGDHISDDDIVKVVDKVVAEMNEKKIPLKFSSLIKKSFEAPGLGQKNVHKGDIIRAIRKVLRDLNDKKDLGITDTGENCSEDKKQ